jgi:hypothetical protein
MMKCISSIPAVKDFARLDLYALARTGRLRHIARSALAFLLRRRAVRPGDHPDMRRLYVLSLLVGPAAASRGSRSAPAPENLKARIASSE